MPVSLYLCLISAAFCYWAGKRSLLAGLGAVIGVGYAYGLMRANVPETFSHFIFDAGVIGLYLAQLLKRLSPVEEFKVGPLRTWLEFLIAWPLLLFFVPIQDYLIQFVGLRGSIFLLPFVFLGARLTGEDRYRLALWIAALNLVAFLFAGAEYFLGLERFFPHNQVTELVYLSKDVIGHTQYRIPSSFANAHAYGGTMVMGLPLLLGALIQKRKVGFQFQLLMLGTGTALLGVLMSAAKTHFVAAVALIIVATFSLRSRFGYAFGWIILICAIGWFASSEQRLQRFVELRDTDSVAERISWSVNMNLLEIAKKYPFGNGLGGGGTSIPYFMQGRIINPVAMENEYARIMLEQGLVGVFIWILFVIWVCTRRDRAPTDSWYLGRRLAFVTCGLYFVTGLTGTGLLTSIPQTSLFLLLVGWVGARQTVSDLSEARVSVNPHEAPAAAELYG
ncbi:MAG TPA: hypothetical protein VLL54_09495 [Pyrinomonadaceae bacterium]|nr:hypothetical protein [Pyrinomonadaceae bacterium]